MESIISFRNVSFQYRTKSTPTLKNINLEIKKGEKILIIGASGSGKSTIAKCINGLIPSTYTGKLEGEISVCGEDPAEAGIFGISKHVGTVLQDTDGQFIGLTVAEDIAFALENDNTPNEEMHKKVLEAARTVDVENLLKAVPGTLSGGQKQRVSLAGILVDNVEVLLFDEPLANLDPAAGKRIISLIDKINSESDKTVIIIEHRLEDVLYKKVDRIIVVEDGQIAIDTTPNELLSTDLLPQKGIREPLYIAALKHAGCKIRAQDNPDNIERMNLEPYKENLKNWFQQIQIPQAQPSKEIALELKNVSFAYDKSKEKTVENISFAIHKGEMISIVGTNGAGKSTIASLICGFNKQDSGKIFLDGQEISKLSIKERGEKIGFVMQNQNQMICKSIIYDETALGLTVRKIPKDKIKEEVFKTLKICGMYPYRNWPVNAVSFGQKKRITIASILVMNPEVIILDEPTAGQDYAHYTEIMEFLRKLNRELGITIIMITHDMHLMLEYTDRAIVLSKGHIIADDKCSKILTNEEITEEASLKKTSLYDLAVKCDFENPSALADAFIYYEQSLRNQAAKEA